MKHVIDLFRDQIITEYARATSLHPEWPSDLVHGAAVVAEEAGELVRAALRVHYEGASMSEVRSEAIQTIVTSIRILMRVSRG